MSRMKSILMVAFALAGGCRPDPGPSRYDAQEPFPHYADAGVPLPGPDPYQPGTKRLSVGAFYESGYSDVIPVDNMTSFVYVYSSTVTLNQDPDRNEGLTSTVATHQGMTWWGFGVNWVMTTHDMSAWTKMHVSFKSQDAAFAAFDIGMSNANPVFVHAADYGWANDGQWHVLTIPVADFVKNGLDKTMCQAPFVLNGNAGKVGEQLKLDDLYFSAD
jgi:hypothetical protein